MKIILFICFHAERIDIKIIMNIFNRGCSFIIPTNNLQVTLEADSYEQLINRFLLAPYK